MKSKLFTNKIIIPVFLSLAVIFSLCIAAKNFIIIPTLEKETYEKNYSDRLSNDGLNLISIEENENGENFAVLTSFQGGHYGIEKSTPFSNYFNCSLQKIDELAYDECTGLKKIIFPNSVTTISKNAIYNCVDLEEVYIPSSVTYISNKAFTGNSKFIMYVEKNSYAEKYAKTNKLDYKYYSSESDNKDYSEYPKVVNNQVYKDYFYSVYYYNGKPEVSIVGIYTSTDETNIKVPETINNIPVKSIAAESFEGCQNITTITLPKTIRSVGNGAFSFCSSLEKVYLTEEVKSIGRDIFFNIDHPVTICAPENSYAHQYALENDIIFESSN